MPEPTIEDMVRQRRRDAFDRGAVWALFGVVMATVFGLVGWALGAALADALVPARGAINAILPLGCAAAAVWLSWIAAREARRRFLADR